jgi:two-component system OmpR family response regulator
MRRFCWLSAGEIPHKFDIRRCGWRLIDDWRTEDAADVPMLAHSASVDASRWVELLGQGRYRQRMLLLGVNTAQERARLLQLGFGDVLDDMPELTELDARTARVSLMATALPRHRDLDGLRLDLFHRDGLVGTRRLGLHPREFALLWRLSDMPGITVSQDTLLADVWQIYHRPETNRVAVHIFRLRAKLALAGFGGLIRTAADGGYFFTPGLSLTLQQAPPFMLQKAMLDEAHVLRDDAVSHRTWNQHSGR